MYFIRAFHERLKCLESAFNIRRKKNNVHFKVHWRYFMMYIAKQKMYFLMCIQSTLESALNVQLKYLGNAHRKAHLTYFACTFEVRKITTCDVCSTYYVIPAVFVMYVHQKSVQKCILCRTKLHTRTHCMHPAKNHSS